MIERLVLVAMSVAISGCATATSTVVPGTSPSPQPAGCEAIVRSYSPLNHLKWTGASADAAELEPSDPQAMQEELAALFAAARAAKPGDAEMTELLGDLSARVTRLATHLHDFTEAKAGSRPEDARAAIRALLGEARKSDDFLAASRRRCDVPEDVKSMFGSLPPEVIQRVVRARFDEFQSCYEAGLRHNPRLRGIVSVHFIIKRDGHLREITNADNLPEDAFGWSKLGEAPRRSAPPSRFPDPAVTDCVLDAFEGLTFPAPGGGIVTVTYPIMFAPGN